MTGEVAPPRFSVVVPVWNRAEVIGRCIASILEQEPAAETIVVDDGSADGTGDAVRRLSADVRIVEEDNRGPSAARNAGISIATGRFVTFLDSDDEALAGWLESFEASFADPSCAVACCGVEDVMDAETARPRVRQPEPMGEAFHSFSALFLPGSYAIRREIIDELGGFAPQLRYAEHHELGMRITALCKQRDLRIRVTTQPLVRRHRAADVRGRSRAYRQARYDSVMYLLEKHADQMRRDGAWFADHLAVAGVSAAGMGRQGEARRLLRGAIRARPQIWRNYGRYMATLVPPLVRRYW